MEDKGCYRKADLTPEDVDYRLMHGYHESEQWDIETCKSETFLLKPRFNESDSHLFLIYRLAEFLYNYTNKVWLFEVNNPDIIFEAPGGKKVAIEVETGECYVKKYDELRKRIKRLDKDFGADWFFVVTNKEYFWKYKKLGRTYTRKQILGVVKSYIKEAKTGSVTAPPEIEIQDVSLSNSKTSRGGENSL